MINARGRRRRRGEGKDRERGVGWWNKKGVEEFRGRREGGVIKREMGKGGREGGEGRERGKRKRKGRGDNWRSRGVRMRMVGRRGHQRKDVGSAGEGDGQQRNSKGEPTLESVTRPQSHATK